jgi:hypothetical protein
MRKCNVWLIALLLAPVMVTYASPAQADAGVSINLPGFGLSVGPGGVGLNIGLPWVVAPAPVPPPAYAYPDNSYESVVTGAVPEFVQPPELGFYVAVGVPYDLFYYNNSYWTNRGNIWYNSPYYNGPWSSINYNNIPYVFNRYPFETIRHYRDTYYGRYQRYGAWEGYNHFSPGHRDNYRGESGRNSRNYARPFNPAQSYRNRPDARLPNSNWQGTRRGYTPDRQINSPRDYRDSRAYTRSYNNGQVNAARPAYTRPNGTGQSYYSRGAQISPTSFAPSYGNRPVYTRSNRNGQSYGNGYSNTRQYSTGQGSAWKGFSQTQNSRGNASRGWQGERR